MNKKKEGVTYGKKTASCYKLAQSITTLTVTTNTAITLHIPH